MAYMVPVALLSAIANGVRLSSPEKVIDDRTDKQRADMTYAVLGEDKLLSENGASVIVCWTCRTPVEQHSVYLWMMGLGHIESVRVTNDVPAGGLPDGIQAISVYPVLSSHPALNGSVGL